MLNHFYVLAAMSHFKNSKMHIASGVKNGERVFSYTFLEIMHKIYLDKDGIFFNLSERKHCLSAPVQYVETFTNIDEAKKHLHSLDILYGDTKQRDEAVKKVEQFVPAVEIRYWGSIVTVGIFDTELLNNGPDRATVAFRNKTTKKFGETCCISGAEIMQGYISSKGLLKRG